LLGRRPKRGKTSPGSRALPTSRRRPCARACASCPRAACPRASPRHEAALTAAAAHVHAAHVHAAARLGTGPGPMLSRAAWYSVPLDSVTANTAGASALSGGKGPASWPTERAHTVQAARVSGSAGARGTHRPRTAPSTWREAAWRCPSSWRAGRRWSRHSCTAWGQIITALKPATSTRAHHCRASSSSPPVTVSIRGWAARASPACACRRTGASARTLRGRGGASRGGGGGGCSSSSGATCRQSIHAARLEGRHGDARGVVQGKRDGACGYGTKA
jgi:hypothetical protein